MNIISSLNTLLSVQHVLKGDEMPGWNSLDESAVKNSIKICAIAAKKSQLNINQCTVFRKASILSSSGFTKFLVSQNFFRENATD